MKKLYLSKTDKKIKGVCGGLAEYFDVDSSITRLGVLFVSLITAIVPAIITYIVASCIIPFKPDHVVHDVK
jgi:phage shock protein C